MPTIFVTVDGTYKDRDVKYIVEATYQVVDDVVEMVYHNVVSSGNMPTILNQTQLDAIYDACIPC